MPDRREFLGAFGTAVGAGLLGAFQPKANAAGPQWRQETLVLDVAILGHTNYDNEVGATNLHPDYAARTPGKSVDGFRESDLRGSTFYFEGLIYPGGTIPTPKETDPNGIDGVNWDFEQEPMGSLFDRGWVIINNKGDGPYEKRPDPHLLGHADYYTGGVVGPDNLTPTDMLTTVGLENGTPPYDVVTRSVIGGTGKYATASGIVTQRRIGRNTSKLRGLDLPYGKEPPSPNFRLTFELLLWS
tara:strand:+ start:170862 stop:171590 length:729 start_codon:yes stop_codon:yes gene_type:complete